MVENAAEPIPVSYSVASEDHLTQITEKTNVIIIALSTLFTVSLIFTGVISMMIMSDVDNMLKGIRNYYYVHILFSFAFFIYLKILITRRQLYVTQREYNSIIANFAIWITISFAFSVNTALIPVTYFKNIVICSSTPALYFLLLLHMVVASEMYSLEVSSSLHFLNVQSMAFSGIGISYLYTLIYDPKNIDYYITEFYAIYIVISICYILYKIIVYFIRAFNGVKREYWYADLVSVIYMQIILILMLFLNSETDNQILFNMISGCLVMLLI